MSIPEIVVTCPNCKKDMKVNISKDVVDAFGSVNSEVRSKIKPVGSIKVYKITSDEIKVFLAQKAKFYVPGTKVEIFPKYSEKKTKDGVKSYAALQVAFSEDIIEKNGNNSFFSKLGEDPDNVHVVQNIWVEMIKQYKFDRKDIENWLGSYKKLEELEDRFGINEKFLEDLRLYSTPRKFPTNDNKESWVIFSARADLIITDMLKNIDTGNLEGNLEIHTVKQINQTLVEFLVYLHPKGTKLKENPLIRKMMEEGNKK